MYKQYYSDGYYTWDVDDLWIAGDDLPTEIIPIETLKLSAMYDNLEENIERVRNADLSYPIIITPEGFVADGMHRIIRAIFEGKEAIAAKRLIKMPEPILDTK